MNLADLASLKAACNFYDSTLKKRSDEASRYYEEERKGSRRARETYDCEPMKISFTRNFTELSFALNGLSVQARLIDQREAA